MLQSLNSARNNTPHIITAAEDVGASIPHTCWRCGKEFRGTARQSVCPACRRIPPRTRLIKQRERAKPQLSVRQLQIVSLVAEGCSNKEIAYRVHLDIGTIRFYMSNILKKLGLGSRTQAAIWYRSLQRPTDPPPTNPPDYVEGAWI